MNGRLTPLPRGELEANQIRDGPLADLCMLDQGTASFLIEGMRALFPVDLQEQPMWPSPKEQQLVDIPPCQLAKRFPSLIHSLVDEVEGLEGDFKAKTAL